MIPITSRDNKTLKLIRSLQRKKGRMDSGLYFAEGTRLVSEALKYRNSDIKFLIASDNFAQKNKNFMNSLDENGKTVYTSKEGLFKEMCNTETPQGIGAVLKIPDVTIPDWCLLKFVLVLDGVSEPGNLGTIIRTAEAAGIDAVVLTKGCADLYNPKVVRSSMGSLFRMICVSDVDAELIADLKSEGFTIVSTALKDAAEITDVKIDGKRAVIIGSEAFGVSEQILKISDIRIKIPMEGMVESLNAAIAAGIVMYMLRI